MSLEWDPEIRVAPVEENSVLDTSLNVGGRVVRREDSVRRKMMSFRGQVTHRGCADHHVQSPCLTSPGLMVGTGAEAVRPLS